MEFAKFENFTTVMQNVVEPENEGSNILRNVRNYSPDYTTLRSRRPDCS
jgi:hypothetical protein